MYSEDLGRRQCEGRVDASDDTHSFWVAADLYSLSGIFFLLLTSSFDEKIWIEVQ